MTDLDLLLSDIEKLQKELLEIINSERLPIIDPEVLIASKMLQAAVLQYHEIILKKI